MTTLAQGDLPKDPGILRAAAQSNKANGGVYADVISGGVVLGVAMLAMRSYYSMTEIPPPLTETPEIPQRVLGKSQAAVEARCHGLRPGGGSSRRTINPIIAHLIMASLVCGSRS